MFGSPKCRGSLQHRSYMWQSQELFLKGQCLLCLQFWLLSLADHKATEVSFILDFTHTHTSLKYEGISFTKTLCKVVLCKATIKS